ncbi:MAG: glycosyltransferase family 2 protein [Actinomycetota bacterium]
MTNIPPICIVLVTYNRAAALVDTLNSIQRQTWTEWELLVCDDASTDDTRQLVAAFMRNDHRIRYLGTERNLGMPCNLNRGLRAASSPLIAIMHDGDVYDCTAVEKWQAAMLKYPTASFVFNGYRVVGPMGKTSALHLEGYPPVMNGGDFLESVFFRRWLFGSPVYGTAMVRKEALEDVGYPDPRYREYADVDLWMRLSEDYDVAFVNEPLIDLASRDRKPEDWGTSSREARHLVRQAFASARARHYSGHSLRRSFELMRHMAFSIMHESWYSAAELKGRVLRGS